jgi:hypothetical protein
MDTENGDKPLYILFWEDISFPPRNIHFSPFIEALQKYLAQLPVDCIFFGGYRPEIPQLQQFLTKRPTIAPDLILVNSFEQLISMQFPPKSQILFITPGEHLLDQIRDLENCFNTILVICDPSNFSRFLAPENVIVRYYEEVARFPENWWLPDADPNSTAHVKSIVSEITDYGEQIRDVSPLLPYLDSPILLVRLLTLDALKKVVWRNATSPDFAQKKDQLITRLRQLERQEVADGTPLRLQPALCDLQKTIRNIEVGQLASLGRNPAPDAFEKIRNAFESGEKDYRRAAVLAFWELGDPKALDILEPYLSKLIDAMLPYIEQNLPVPEDIREEEAFIRSKIHDIRENISPNYWLARKLLE